MSHRPPPSIIPVKRKLRGRGTRKRRTVIAAALALVMAAATLAVNYHSGALRILHPALGTVPWVSPEDDFDGDNARNRLDPYPFEADADGDGLGDGLEILQLGTDPSRTDPSVAYAVKRGIDLGLVRHLKILDEDGVLSDKERKFLDRLAFVASDLIPEDLVGYYTDDEILDLQKSIVSSILEDGEISTSEVEAFDRLCSQRWYVARDVMLSGMVSDDALYENWDQDSVDGKPLSNVAEILQGTNPLSDLEVEPDDLTERHAIIVGRIHFDARYNWYVYHQLRKNGYVDEDIVLSIYSASGKEDDLVVYGMDFERMDSGDWIGDRAFYGKNLLTDFPVEPDYTDMTSTEFLNAIENMSLDDNDLGLIVYIGHGPQPTFADSSISPQQLADSLSSLKGRVVYMHGACQAEMFLGNPIFSEYLSGKEILLLGAMSAEETGGAAFSFSFLENLQRGYSVRAAFENAQKYVIQSFDEHPTKHYFGQDDSWCDSADFIRHRAKLEQRADS